MEELKLEAIEATPETFHEFGQVIEATPDSAKFGPCDAQLDLSHGTPRLYIMRLEGGELSFSDITHHASVTQCLGSVGSHDWYFGVAKSSVVDPNADANCSAVRSCSGHHYLPPDVSGVRAFRVSGTKFLKLNKGTWHAGPLFKDASMDFYNLELSNTGIVDHTTHSFQKENGVRFAIEE